MTAALPLDALRTALEERFPKVAENTKAILGKALQTIPPQPYRQ